MSSMPWTFSAPGSCEFGFLAGSPNGIRTRVSTLRGWCPRPLDDGAVRGEVLEHALALQGSGWRHGQRSLIMLVARVPDSTTAEPIGRASGPPSEQRSRNRRGGRLAVMDRVNRLGCRRPGVQPLSRGRLQRGGVTRHPGAHVSGVGCGTAREPSWRHLQPGCLVVSDRRTRLRTVASYRRTRRRSAHGLVRGAANGHARRPRGRRRRHPGVELDRGQPGPDELLVRRHGHETLIHRVDVELAQGFEPAHGYPEVAADTVTEFFELFYPAVRDPDRRGRAR